MGEKTMEQKKNTKNIYRLMSTTRIISAAIKLFGTYGYSNTSIAKIAKEAGVAVGLVMKYFQSKENLFLSAYLSILHKSYEYATVPVPECLVRIIKESKDLRIADPEGFRLLKNVVNTYDIPGGSQKLKEDLFEPSYINVALKDAQDKGIIPKGDRFGLFAAFLANVYNNIDFAYNYNVPMPEDEYFLNVICLEKLPEHEKEEKREISLEMVRQAVANNQLCVYYQPIVEGQTGRIIAAEALVRWKHPEKGVIPPDMFVPLMEDRGFISEIDSFILKHVWNKQKERLEANEAVLPITVNLSWMDFYNRELLDWLMDNAQSGIYPKGLLCCEVTESSYAALKGNVSQIFREFKELNIRSLLDDFGKGVSSLETLQKYNFDILKIDMSFTEEIGKNAKTKEMLQAIIDMCHQIGLKVVAEGVETPEQYEFYKYSNCDYIQGFYFYKPMSEEDFLALLDAEIKSERLADFNSGSKLLPSSYYKAYLYFPNEEMRHKANFATEKILQLIGENSGVGAVSGLYDDRYSLCFFSNLLAELLGYSNHEFVEFTQGSYLNLIAPEDREEYLKDEGAIRYYSVLDANGKYQRVKEVRSDVISTSGEKQWVAAIRKTDMTNSNSLFKPQDLPKAIVNFDARLYTDGLTGVLNRNFYIDNEAALETTALAILDVDIFKNVNDTFGHLAGDEALKVVAATMKESVRNKDLIIRYGGDEFVIVFNGAPKHVLKERLENLRRKISELTFTEYPELKITCSIGAIACNSASKECLREADSLLYKAKQLKNTVVLKVD